MNYMLEMQDWCIYYFNVLEYHVGTYTIYTHIILLWIGYHIDTYIHIIYIESYTTLIHIHIWIEYHIGMVYEKS